MESQKPKIAMYVKRNFGEKLSASFDFIKENWKLMLKFTTYLLLPICLIQALSLNGLMGYIAMLTDLSGGGVSSDASLMMSFFSYYSLYMFVFLIGTYNERDERLQGVTLGMLRPMLLRNVKRLVVMTLFGLVLMVLLGVIMGLMAALLWPVLFLVIPFVIILAVPFALWAPIYLFEDISVMESLKKTFRLGFATWGGIFLISLIMGLIAGILQGVTMMPWYIGTIVKSIFAMSSGGSEATVSVGYNFMLYLLAIVQAFGAYLAMIFSLVGLAYQYGHASEKVDNIMVESDIDNFDKL